MVKDDIETLYEKYPYGKKPVDQTEVQTEAENSQPIGDFEADRDNENGYPSSFKTRDTNEKFVNNYINKKNGAFITQFDVDQAADAKAEKELKEASEKTKFKVPSGMINDWTGNRFVYERPYGAVNLQLD